MIFQKPSVICETIKADQTQIISMKKEFKLLKILQESKSEIRKKNFIHIPSDIQGVPKI